MTAMVLLFAVGALPALFIWALAYLISPRLRSFRLALVLLLSAVPFVLFLPASVLLLPIAITGFAVTVLAFELAARKPSR